MKKLKCIPMLLIAALVLCSGISESFAQPPPDPCTVVKKNGNATYSGSDGLFICVSEIIPDDDPEDWDNLCDCHDDCLYIHIRNNITSCDTSSAAIESIRIALQNDSTSDDICIGGPFKQFGLTPWTNPWPVTFAGTTTAFPRDTCISWGIDLQKPVDTKKGTGGNDILDIGNHWTAKVCGSQSFLIQVTYPDNFPPPQNKTFGPFTLNTVPCPEFGNDHGWQ